MSSRTRLISWNIRGIRSSRAELDILLEKGPDVVCLQETKLPADLNYYKINNYSAHHLIHPEGQIACGGVSILTRRGIPHRKLDLQTGLQAIAVRCTLHRPITVCSVYIPPDRALASRELELLLDQLPAPYVIMGDFNAHSPLWGNTDTNRRGNVVESFLTKTDVYLANGVDATRVNPNTLSTSAIDLTLCDPVLAPELSWTVIEDDHGSDHFPVCLDITPPGILPGQRPRHWCVRRANWDMFTQECLTYLTNETDSYDQFIEKLTQICNLTIPKSSGKPRKHNPWFSEECQVALQEKRKAYRRAMRFPTLGNIILFKKARAKCRRVFRENKRRSFRNFVSKLSSQTSLNKVWKMIRKLKGTESDSLSHILRPDGSRAESEEAIANALAERLSHNSSSAKHSPEFLRAKQRAETTQLNFDTGNREEYNNLFTLEELRACLADTGSTAPGPDEISYEILRRLPGQSLGVLLNLYNEIWTTQSFPDSWSLATVIPIPKPGKDHSDPSNYRPISLTSCLCKLMEKMVNKRLMWFLEHNNSLSDLQCGFRKNRSTTDHLVRLESFIRESFAAGEHMVAVFFDLEKAFDTTWKFGILRDLHGLGMRGNLPLFVRAFLNNRSFQVKVGSTLSDPFDQEEGVPQGSILSPILFEIKINSIVNELRQNIDGSLYVDDFLVCYRSKSNIDTIERQLQLQLNKLKEWADLNGFSFSPTKTVAVHFCRKHTCIREPDLYLDNQRIEVMEKARFLGVIFDKKLNFLAHIKDLKLRCMKALRVMKVLSSKEWGSDSDTLLQVYRTLIRSKLDYGCFIYGSAKPSYLGMLDPIHHQGLRLALGAYRTSPVESLYAEADEPPLKLRRKKLALQYATKLKAFPKNPVQKHILGDDPKMKRHIERHPGATPPLGHRLEKDFEGADIQLGKIETHARSQTPPWSLRRPDINLELCKSSKQNTDPLVLRHTFEETISKYKDHLLIFTDGSKSDDAVGCAFYSSEGAGTQRLDADSSIFTAESRAISKALTHAAKSRRKKVLVLSDSLSVLKGLQNFYCTDPRLTKILDGVDKINRKGREVRFLWVPSHVGIRGNEVADRLAKEALLSDRPESSALPSSDLKPKIKKYVREEWRKTWSLARGNKLNEIKPDLNPRRKSGLNRINEVRLTRLRIGHTALTHGNVLKGEDRPICRKCDRNRELSVKHILVECDQLDAERSRFYSQRDLRSLFEQVDPRIIFEFLKAIDVLNRL